MDDPQTSTEYTGRLYLWRIRKRGQRVHIKNPETERAYCQAENCSGGKPFDGRGAEVPAGRQTCMNCTDLTGRTEADYREPDLKVLLGERLAETKPRLFPSAVAPKPRKRGKQAWAISRSKGRKPKRSPAKYPRPFNDDLPPWL